MIVERTEDMSPDGRLRLIPEDDGDMIVAVIDEKGRSSSVQFCSVGSGGGRSPRTLRALRQLYRAMSRDNAESTHNMRRDFPGDVNRFPKEGLDDE